MIEKILVLLTAASLSISIEFAHAQSPAKIPRIGVLTFGAPALNKIQTQVLRQGLQELGYVEGKNVLLEIKYAGWRGARQANANQPESERLDELAKELVGLRVDIIVAIGTIAAVSAQRATKTIPIVMTGGDPVRAGLVSKFARPGGNITGVASMSGPIAWKRLELLKEINPKTSVVGILQDETRDDPGILAQMRNVEAAAHALGLRLIEQEVQSDDYERAFADIKRRGADSLFMLVSNKQRPIYPRIAELAAKSRIPAVYPNSDSVDAGGLISYGASIADMYRRAAYYVDRILKGAKPANLPVETPTKFELVVNLKAAKQIGLTIPSSVLNRADRIIREE